MNAARSLACVIKDRNHDMKKHDLQRLVQMFQEHGYLSHSVTLSSMQLSEFCMSFANFGDVGHATNKQISPEAMSVTTTAYSAEDMLEVAESSTEDDTSSQEDYGNGEAHAECRELLHFLSASRSSIKKSFFCGEKPKPSIEEARP